MHILAYRVSGAASQSSQAMYLLSLAELATLHVRLFVGKPYPISWLSMSSWYQSNWLTYHYAGCNYDVDRILSLVWLTTVVIIRI